jgi:hypothetical protein
MWGTVRRAACSHILYHAPLAFEVPPSPLALLSLAVTRAYFMTNNVDDTLGVSVPMAP